MNDRELTPVEHLSLYRDFGAGAPTEEPEESLGKKIGRHLRGRWGVALVLALLLAAGGAAAGFFLYPVEYRSVGLIDIAPVMPRILYNTEQTDVIPMFDAYVESQVAKLRSRRVIDQAMRSDEWRAIGRGTSNRAVSEFIDSLQVEHPSQTRYVVVSFMDADPHAAKVAVGAVIDAYLEIHGEGDIDDDRKKMSILENHLEELTAERKAKERLLSSLTEEFGHEALIKLYDQKVDMLAAVEEQLDQVSLALTMEQGRQKAGDEAAAPTDLSAEDIAVRDPTMAGYLIRRRTLEASKERLVERGLGPNSAQVADLSEQLRVLGETIDAYTESYRKMALADGTVSTVEQLENQEKRLANLHQKTKDELQKISSKRRQIETVVREQESVEKRLSDTQNRIDQLSLESSVSGRIHVLTRGDVPVEPFNDKRAAIAVVGGGGGAGLAFALVLLLGSLDRRLQSSRDIHEDFGRQNRILGILPKLTKDIMDPEQADLAAHCVHQIRAILQIGSREGQTFVVSSPMAGTGKTTLTLALGLSFASTGSRTLIIDGDFVGGGLSSRVNSLIRRKVEAILAPVEPEETPSGGKGKGKGPKRKRKRLPAPEGANGRPGGLRDSISLSFREYSPHVVDESAELADRVQRFLARSGSPARDRALLYLVRFLARQAAVEEDDRGLAEELHRRGLLHDGKQKWPGPGGLRAYLDGRSFESSIVQTGVPNFDALCLTGAHEEDVDRLSPKVARRLLTEARKHYDIVLLDTGPAPGSIEASLFSAEADGVVLVVSRGEQRPMADRALDHLRSLGADVRGVVFNRAEMEDAIQSSCSRSSQKSKARYGTAARR